MFCRNCGAQIADQAATCSKCGCRNVAVQPSLDIENSTAVRLALPVGRTPLSIIAGYLGLFSLTFILAPVSLIVGILAIRDLKAHPDKHGLGRAWFGTIMGGVFSILAVVMLLVAVCSA